MRLYGAQRASCWVVSFGLGATYRDSDDKSKYNADHDSRDPLPVRAELPLRLHWLLRNQLRLDWTIMT